jgi:hypothetical protein
LAARLRALEAPERLEATFLAPAARLTAGFGAAFVTAGFFDFGVL